MWKQQVELSGRYSYSYAEDVIVQYAYEYPKDLKSQIVLELIGKYTETHNILYGIVAYISYISYVSLSVSRVSNSKQLFCNIRF